MRIKPTDTHLIGEKIIPVHEAHLYPHPFIIKFLGETKFFGMWMDGVEAAMYYDEDDWQLVSENDPVQKLEEAIFWVTSEVLEYVPMGVKVGTCEKWGVHFSPAEFKHLCNRLIQAGIDPERLKCPSK